MNMEQAFEVLNDAQMPHCDQSVLHAPGECKYCDMHPDWQALRVIWGVSFTGQTTRVSGAKVSCPSDYVRGVGGAHFWPGNRPSHD